MSENNGQVKEEEDVVFAFLVIKQKDGAVGLRVKDNEEIAVDDVYAAICLLKRNIETQQTAGMIQQAMLATAQQMQQGQNSQPGNRTAGGLIVPDDIKLGDN